MGGSPFFCLSPADANRNLDLGGGGGDGLNSLHATGTFMCPHNASALRDGHIYVPADAV